MYRNVDYCSIASILIEEHLKCEDQIQRQWDMVFKFKYDIYLQKRQFTSGMKQYIIKALQQD